MPEQIQRAEAGLTVSNAETSVVKVLDTRKEICQLPHQQLSPVVNLFVAVCVFLLTSLYPHTLCHHLPPHFPASVDPSKHGPASFSVSQASLRQRWQCAWKIKQVFHEQSNTICPIFLST